MSLDQHTVPRSTVRLALLAPLGAGLFTLALLVFGFVSPGYPLFDMVIETYSPVSQPISGLGLGVTAPWMNAAFIVCGVLVAAGVLSASRTWPRAPRPRARLAAQLLLTASGLGVSICGLFDLEAVMPHLLGFLLAVGAPTIGFVLAGVTLRQVDPLASRWLLVAGPLTLVLLVTFMATFDPMAAADDVGFAGLTQRLLVTITLATTGLLGYRAATPIGTSAHTPTGLTAREANDGFVGVLKRDPKRGTR